MRLPWKPHFISAFNLMLTQPADSGQYHGDISPRTKLQLYMQAGQRESKTTRTSLWQAEYLLEHFPKENVSGFLLSLRCYSWFLMNCEGFEKDMSSFRTRQNNVKSASNQKKKTSPITSFKLSYICFLYSNVHCISLFHSLILSIIKGCSCCGIFTPPAGMVREQKRTLVSSRGHVSQVIIQ